MVHVSDWLCLSACLSVHRSQHESQCVHVGHDPYSESLSQVVGDVRRLSQRAEEVVRLWKRLRKRVWMRGSERTEDHGVEGQQGDVER